MKWRIFFLAPLSFFVIPLCAHATTTTYFAQNNKEKIILTTIGATTTLTLELTGDTYSYDIRINDPKGKEVYSHPGVRGKTTTLTIPNLAPNTQYSLWLGAGGPYTFITTPGDPVVTNGNYTLRLVQYNGTVQAVYIVPKDDKSVFYLRFDKNGSQQLELAVSNGATSANSPTLTTYTYDLGDLTKRLGTGIYAVTLEGVNPKTTEKTDLVGPFYLSLFDTSLTYQWPLTITVDKKGGATLNGKVDFLKDFSASDYTVTIATNEGEPVFDGEGAPVAKPISLASDGSYSLVLSGLTPSGTYYFQQKVHSRVSSEDVRMGKFNADTGIVPMEGEVGYQKNFDSHSYRLLSPLPNLSFVFDPDLCRDYVAENKTLPPGTICDINQFINYIMKLLIGLAGVMLVLRIMFEGYQYLVTDVPALKSGAKNSIVESALGLVLALSAYLILNTINPQLVSNGVQLNDVAAGILQEDFDSAPITSDGVVTIPKEGLLGCREGVDKINTSGGSFYACKTISSNLKKMIDAAWAQNIKISGSGWRTKETQISFRIAHCGGNTTYNIYKKPSGQCKPPTAIPGTSRHENGLAFDLRCDGQSIKSRDSKCFTWLKTNAGKYGFYNLASEPWHWSVDGH